MRSCAGRRSISAAGTPTERNIYGGETQADDRVRRLRNRARAQGGHGRARRHRSRHADRHGPARAPLAHGAQGRIRYLRSQCRRLFHGAGSWSTAHGDPGVPPPPLPARIPVRQRRRRHSRAEGPHRQEGGRNEFPARLQHLDARHSGRGVRPAAPAGDLDGRAQRGRGLHAAEGPSHRDDRAGKEARRHAGGGRNPGHAIAGAAALVPRRRQADRAAVSQLQGHRARLFPQVPASFRSCT